MLKEHSHFQYVEDINGKIFGTSPSIQVFSTLVFSAPVLGWGCHLELQNPALALVQCSF